MASRALFTIGRHPDGEPGWWVTARVEWGEGSSVQGLARSVPFRTQRDARAWIVEQFGPRVVINGREVGWQGRRRR